jgi:hypothetical protein
VSSSSLTWSASPTLARDATQRKRATLLSRYFDQTREIIGRYGGTVEKFIGDAVMAVWGAPVAHENDAERAVRARSTWSTRCPPRAGPAGSRRRHDRRGGGDHRRVGEGMVAGDIVNTASRLQSVAPPGRARRRGTQRAAHGGHRLRASRRAAAQGQGRAGHGASRCAGNCRARRPRPVGPARGAAGRPREELRLLKELFHATARERRRSHGLDHRPGRRGKSRITRELSRYLDGIVETVYWHFGRSPAYGEGSPSGRSARWFASAAGLAESDDEATTRGRIAEAVDDGCRTKRSGAGSRRALLALLGTKAPARARAKSCSPRGERSSSASRRGPTVLVFEDLESADPGLLDFIDHLLDWTRGVPLFIVTLARPEIIDRRPSWGAGRKNFVALGLDPLPEPQMRELLGELVPGLPERAASRSCRAPTASRCTRWRLSACSLPRAS